MRNTLLFIVSFCFFSVGFAQDVPDKFSLDQAIVFALENNRTAKNAARDIEAAKQQKWQTTATGLPQLNGKIDYQYNIKQQFEQAVDFGDDGFIDFGAKQSVNASATLTQLIFDGSYLVGLQSAKVFLEISKNAKDKTDLEIRKAVINAYGNVLLSEESVAILEKNKTTLEKNLRETTKIYENGLTEEEDVEQLKITLSSIESNLKNVKRLRDISYQMFNITLGIDLNHKTELTDNLEALTSQNIVFSLLEIDEGVQNTIDYKIAANDKRSKELLLKLEKTRSLPTLSGFLNGAYLGNGDQFQFLTNNQKWQGISAWGLSLNIPIFSSFANRASTQRAKINLEKSEDDLLETEQQLLLQIAAAKSDYRLAIEQYDTSKKNLNLAERIEKKNQIKFFEGVATSFELRQAQTQLYTAQQEYLQTMLDVISKKAELETVLNEVN